MSKQTNDVIWSGLVENSPFCQRHQEFAETLNNYRPGKRQSLHKKERKEDFMQIMISQMEWNAAFQFERGWDSSLQWLAEATWK